MFMDQSHSQSPREPASLQHIKNPLKNTLLTNDPSSDFTIHNSGTSSINQRSSNEDHLLKVFFTDLKKSTSKATVMAAFSKYGKIDQIKFPFNKKRQRNLGYGWVRFSELAVSQFLLQTLRVIEIEGHRVELQSFQTDKDPKCSTEIKKYSSNIRKYIKEQSVEKFNLNPSGNNRVPKQLPIPRSTEAQELYIIRWDCHSIKPNNSLYFKLAYPKPLLHDTLDQNLSFRILHPSVSKRKDQLITRVSGPKNSQN